MDSSGRLGETVRDQGDYCNRDHGDQGIYGARMDNSRRLGETARDWGDYKDHGDQGSLHRERGIHNTGRLGEI